MPNFEEEYSRDRLMRIIELIYERYGNDLDEPFLDLLEHLSKEDLRDWEASLEEEVARQLDNKRL